MVWVWPQPVQNKNRMKKVLKEACVQDYFEAKKAEGFGADRVELCANLEVGGLTPGFDEVEKCLYGLSVPTKVMIRCREGDFVYSMEEVSAMKQQIKHCKRLGVGEIVFGALTNDNHLDVPLIQDIAREAFPMKVTLHKAIDEVDTPQDELKKILDIGNVKSILTSGKKDTAIEGALLIKELYEVYQYRFEIIAAGKITNENLNEIVNLVGAMSYHGKKIVGDLSR